VKNNESALSEEIRKKLRAAEIYYEQGLFKESQKIYLSILSQDKDQITSEIPINLDDGSNDPMTLIEFIEEKLKKIEQLESFPEKDSESVEGGYTFFYHGKSLAESGFFDDAISAFKNAARLGYKEADCYESIGTLYLNQHQYKQSIEFFKKALETNTTDKHQENAILAKIAQAQNAEIQDKESLSDKGDAEGTDEKLSDFPLEKQKHPHAKKFVTFDITWVCKYPWRFLTASILVAAFFIGFIPFLKIENNVDFFFNIVNDPSRKIYDEIRDVFGNDEFFVIAFEKKDIFTAENLTRIKQLTEEIANLEEVRDINSITNVDDTIGEDDYFEVRKFIEDIPDNLSDLKDLKYKAVNKPLYVKNIISKDGKTAAIVVFTYQRPDDENYRQRMIKKVRTILSRYTDDGTQYYFTGWASINVSLSEFQNRDMKTFVPLTYLLIPIIVLYFFRNIRLTILAIANISICLGATMGMFGLMGISINGVTTIIQPLVMALSLCDTVHIFSHLDKRILIQFPDRRDALAHVLKRVVLPCFLTSLTTAIGFLSLSVSDLVAIREFAWLASSGMLFEFIFSFFFLPPLLLMFDPKTIYCDFSPHKGVTAILTRINTFIQNKNRLVVGFTCFIVLASLWYTTQIRVETNPLDYFKKNTSVRQAIDFVEKRLAGVDTLDISLKADTLDAFKEPSNLYIIEKIENYLNTLNGVDKTISLNDFLKDMNESFHAENPEFYTIPESRALISQYLLLYDSDDIEDVINSDYDHARIAVRVSEHGTQGQERLIRKVKEFISTLNHPELEIAVTGRIVQHAGVIHAMVNSQIYSLSLAAGTISIIMLLALRSLPIGLLSLIPNLFPIVINFGIMGIAGIPLNTGTALISAVALGIAVDDTIHFLNEYNLQRRSNTPIPSAVERVITTKGRALIISSFILAIGFGVVVLGSFVPIIQFGTLTAGIMITALFGDLVVLPSILLQKKEKAFSGNLNKDDYASSTNDPTEGVFKKNSGTAESVIEDIQPPLDDTVRLLRSKASEYGLQTKEAFFSEAFSRNIGFLTVSEQERLADARVAIPGLGGVGGAHLITLIRSGVGKFNLADFDIYEPVNMNRQYGARVPNFGQPKLATMVKDALNINPFLEIKAFPKGLRIEIIDDFLEGVQVVVDSLDFFAFDIRRTLFNRAREKGIYVVTAAPLGFSSAVLIFSPHEGMGFDEYFDIHDGLEQKEKYFRFAMGLAPKATHIKYMDMSKVDLESKAGPSLGIACQLCSAMAATETLRIILGRKHIKPAPSYCQFDPYLKKFRSGILRKGNRNFVQRIKMVVAKKMLESRAKKTP